MTTSHRLEVLEHDVTADGAFSLWMTREVGGSMFAAYRDEQWAFTDPFSTEKIVPTHHETIFAESSRLERS